jgi:hypothetical protein
MNRISAGSAEGREAKFIRPSVVFDPRKRQAAEK